MKLLLLYSLAYADLEIKFKKISISNRDLTQNLRGKNKKRRLFSRRLQYIK